MSLTPLPKSATPVASPAAAKQSVSTSALPEVDSLASGIPAASVTDPERLKSDSSVRTYRCSAPNSVTFAPNGQEIQFLGGVFSTDDEYLIAWLDHIAGQRNSTVSREGKGVDVLNADAALVEIEAAADKARAAAGS